MSTPPVTANDHEQQLIDYLIKTGEAVQYGERWTRKTTHEWWVDSTGQRHCRLVQTYHGGGGRGDDDEAEYVRRLIDMGRAHPVPLAVPEDYELTEADKEQLRDVLPGTITHVLVPSVQNLRGDGRVAVWGFFRRPANPASPRSPAQP